MTGGHASQEKIGISRKSASLSSIDLCAEGIFLLLPTELIFYSHSPLPHFLNNDTFEEAEIGGNNSEEQSQDWEL